MADFSLSRSTLINATPDQVLSYLIDFRKWTAWSPWEDLDPEMEHTYAGAESGEGAIHRWKGNSKAGEGEMTITATTPTSVVCDLLFIKPFKAENISRFDLTEVPDGTDVTWTMTGQQNPLMRLLGKLFFDKAIAKDFDKGLAKLKAVAEA